ncbi:GntR family transcriptional regulator [soil metagenome]
MDGSRWREVAERYRADIESGRLEPGDRLPTDVALAELNGISRATAHRALAELQRWGLVVRQRRVGTLVASRESTRTGRVALVLDQIVPERDFPRHDLVGGLHAGLGEDHSLLWCDSKLDVDREIDFLQRMATEADGIICWPTGDPRTTPVLRELVEKRVPIVLLDRIPEGLEIDAVTNDSVDATRHALEFLFSRGHERIGFFGFNKPHVSTVVERIAAFRAVYAERGLSTEGLMRLIPAELEFSDDELLIQAVHDAFFTLRHGSQPITAAFCVQDMLGMAVQRSADALGVRVPDDLEIATYNDWPAMMLPRPWQAHRIVTGANKIGLAAAERLNQLMLRLPNSGPEVLRIPAEFIIAQAGLLPDPHRSVGQFIKG